MSEKYENCTDVDYMQSTVADIQEDNIALDVDAEDFIETFRIKNMESQYSRF